MDKNITLYQITNEMAEKVFQKIDRFNKGRREDIGYYAISVSTVLIMPCGAFSLTIVILPCLYARWLSLLMMLPSVRFCICRTAISC